MKDRLTILSVMERFPTISHDSIYRSWFLTAIKIKISDLEELLNAGSPIDLSKSDEAPFIILKDSKVSLNSEAVQKVFKKMKKGQWITKMWYLKSMETERVLSKLIETLSSRK